MEKKPDILLWISSSVHFAAAGVLFFNGHPVTAATFLSLAVVLFPPATAASVHLLGETVSNMWRGVLFFGALLVIVGLTIQPGEPEVTTTDGDTCRGNIISTIVGQSGCTPLEVQWVTIDPGDTGPWSPPPGPAVRITYLQYARAKRETAPQPPDASSCAGNGDRATKRNLKAMELLHRLVHHPSFSDVTTFILLPRVRVRKKDGTETVKEAGMVVFWRSGEED